MIKFGKILTFIISIILFSVGFKYLYCSIIFGNDQYQIAGVFVALGASIFGIYIHIFNIAHKQSEKYLDFSLNQFEDVIKLISKNNDRVKWITSSRILASIDKLSSKISRIEHKELFEIQKLKYKTIISDIIKDENKTGAFFYGSDNWSEDIDEAAKKSTSTTIKQQEQGYIGGLKNLAEVSLYKLWKFSQFPSDYSDPLGDETFSDKEINYRLRGHFPGLFEYLQHRRNYQAIDGKLVELGKKNK